MASLLRSLTVFFSIFVLFAIFPCCAQLAAPDKAEFVFPYNVRDKNVSSIVSGSINNIYLSLEISGQEAKTAYIEIELPKNFQPQALPEGWQSSEYDEKNILKKELEIAPHFDVWVDLLPIKCAVGEKIGDYPLHLTVDIAGKKIEKKVIVNVLGQSSASTERWNVANIVLPVDRDGIYDGRAAQNVFYVSDWDFESLRSRLLGKGAANLNALEAHPAGWFLLEIDNPAHDSSVLRLKAELTDKKTGEILPGLRTAGVLHDDGDFAMTVEEGNASQAMLTLAGQEKQNYVIPIYTETDLTAGSYGLKITVSGPERIIEKTLPLDIVVRRNSTMYVLGFAVICVFSFVVLFSLNVRKWLLTLGAKGVITISLFAAVAFGGITLPTTILNDFLHVFFGPFAAFVSGLLSSTFYYLLLTALFLLYPKTGTVSCLLLVRFLLGALLLGRITPVGIMLLCTQAVILESFLYFMRQQGGFPSIGKRLTLAFVLACADSISTLVNLELMMFFYRLYYADWYIWLYVLLCGFVYTAAGSWLGYALGQRLKSVTGE